MGEQAENLKRVRGAIGDWIYDFCLWMAADTCNHFRGNNFEFHLNELADYIIDVKGKVTYDSYSRILRLLRQEGKIGYKVVKRSESLYRLLMVKDDKGNILFRHPELQEPKPGQQELVFGNS